MYFFRFRFRFLFAIVTGLITEVFRRNCTGFKLVRRFFSSEIRKGRNPTE